MQMYCNRPHLGAALT